MFRLILFTLMAFYSPESSTRTPAREMRSSPPRLSKGWQTETAPTCTLFMDANGELKERCY